MAISDAELFGINAVRQIPFLESAFDECLGSGSYLIAANSDT